MSAVGAIELHLELDGEADPISGCVRQGADVVPLVFTGWVERVQAIERIRAAERLGPPTTGEPPHARPAPVHEPDTTKG